MGPKAAKSRPSNLVAKSLKIENIHKDLLKNTSHNLQTNHKLSLKIDLLVLCIRITKTLFVYYYFKHIEAL